MTKAKSDGASVDAAAETREVEKRVADDIEKGYRGTVPDPLPNSAHSLESGPDSPPLIESNTTRAPQYGVDKGGDK